MSSNPPNHESLSQKPTDTEQPKETFSPDIQTTEQNPSSDSATEVNLSLNSARVTCSFKCERKLWKAFISYSQANYGSVCHLLEPILKIIVSSEVYQSRTIKPIVIQNLNIERAVKRVRRYSPDDSIETLEHEEFKVSVQRSREQVRLEKDDLLFRRVMEQWEIHSDPKWREMWIQKAREKADSVPTARMLLNQGREASE
jgi:hypothetical protein